MPMELRFVDIISNNHRVGQVDLVHGGGHRQAKGFDLVFIDYVMATMNGPEAVQIMRSSPRASSV